MWDVLSLVHSDSVNRPKCRKTFLGCCCIISDWLLWYQKQDNVESWIPQKRCLLIKRKQKYLNFKEEWI